MGIPRLFAWRRRGAAPRLGAVLLFTLCLIVPTLSANAADAGWKSEYFANQTLSGTPALVRTDADLNFNWGWGAPAPGIPPDHFSVRWTRSVNFPTAGNWRFMAAVDDGVRVWVDGQAVIDQWLVTAPITYTSTIGLGAGDHTVKVEYFENTERALIRVWWDQGGAAPTGTTPTPAAPKATAVFPAIAGDWEAKYYNNRYLKDSPLFTRTDPYVYFDWGSAGPGSGLGGTDYSVRWQRTVFFPPGEYEFKVKADDGVRVWIDWALMMEDWHDGGGKSLSKTMNVSGGNHILVVQYYQAGGNGNIKFTWQPTNIEWKGNIITCMAPTNSWIKVYRLAPNNQWEDLKSAGYGPMSPSGELKIWGVAIDGSWGWDGQPFKIELWVNGKLVRSEGDILAGQPALRMVSNNDLRTSWGCGADLPTS